jgi:8-amino-7-oxononanoate synthase
VVDTDQAPVRELTGWLATLDHKARLRARAGLARELRPRAAADPAIDLAGNDYLGLARHPSVTAAAAQALSEYGLGATGSRLVRGSTDLHAALEADLAGWLGAEAALVYSSGYLANLGAVRALTGPRTLLVSDAHNHASLVDGCRAGRAEVVVFPHLDVAAAGDAVAAARAAGRPAVVVTESIFSVDGDLAPLRELHATARRHGALLLVDDAHALGVIGPAGAGGVAAAGLSGEPDVVVTATLSKALGGAGGVVAGPAAFVHHLVDTGRTFIYDTALPPAVVAGVRAAVGLARVADHQRAELAARARQLAALGAPGVGVPGARDVAGVSGVPGARGVPGVPGVPAAGSAPRAPGVPAPGSAPRAPGAVPPPAGGVVSLRAPSAPAAVAWAAACRERGVAVGCFRPPSTPDNQSRLRLTVNVGVPRDAFEYALRVIDECRPEPFDD